MCLALLCIYILICVAVLKLHIYNNFNMVTVLFKNNNSLNINR